MTYPTSDDAPFDMPSSGTWEERGGWVVNAIAGDFELDPIVAAAIVGNCGFESAGFTKLQEIAPIAGQGGYGWPQWTGPRRRAFEAWCQEHNLAPASDEANYGYLCDELDQGYAGALDKLRAVTGSSDAERLSNAVFLWGRLFEGPAGTTPTHLPGFDGRLSYASRALAGAHAAGTTPTPTPGAGKASPAPTGSVAAGTTILEDAEKLAGDVVDAVKGAL